MAQLTSIAAPFALQFLTDRLSDKKIIPPLWDKTEWCRVTSNELRNSLNTVILPLGRVNVGVYLHCSLLFKHIFQLKPHHYLLKECCWKLLEPVQPEKRANVELRTSYNSTKYWSNNALSLRLPTGVHPLDVFGCDNTLKHAVKESTRHQLEPVQYLVNYELCSESKNEGPELAAIAANRVSPNESPSVAIIPVVTNASAVNISEIVGGASPQKISEEYPLPTVMGSSNGMVDYSEGKSKMKGLRSVQGMKERFVFQGGRLRFGVLRMEQACCFQCTNENSPHGWMTPPRG
ncbi:hypothetical protein Nepgr_024451 [Nepenthes gracilis]|uniref:Uncharacterized protein n=1 Tax=Nepenthes gracilis TaxID=150966 RepID=A0AAD3T2V2_NEPGR|nr:hypothetical protein Nepgr_024451 [Nepenthes gracilis]